MHGHATPDGDIRVCCNADLDLPPIGRMDGTTISDAMSRGEHAMAMRREMMRGLRPDACVRCYDADDSGGVSYRSWANSRWGHLRAELEDGTAADGSISDYRMLYMDVRPSNLCNLACRTCYPGSSSTLAAMERRHDQARHDVPVLLDASSGASVSLLDQLMEHLDTVEEIYFAGGEPLLMDEHLAILEELARRGRYGVRIRYSTNMTSLDRGNVLDLWSRFDRISIVASIDSWGTRAEYLRQGCDWGSVEANLLSVRDRAANVVLTINSVVSVFNFMSMPGFWTYLYDRGILSNDSVGNSWTKLHSSPVFRISNLPIGMRRQGILAIEALSEALARAGRNADAHMGGFREFMDLWDHPDLDPGQTISAIARLDAMHGTRCHDAFPEIAAWLSDNGYS